MFATFPSAPRGRSRFSKALPVAPDQSSREQSSMAMMATTNQSPLPVLPNDAMVPPKTIPRRPVGGQAKPSKPASIRSLSSVYSDSPGLSRSFSDSSTKDSRSTVDLETDQIPPPHPKHKEQRQTTNILDSPPGLSGSPPQPELWKRRSIKSEKNIVFELKLSKSNGSTASPPRRQEQSTDRPLPQSITSRKPAPQQAMGNKIAKLEGKLGDLKLKNKTESEKPSTQTQDEAPPKQNPPFQRLPTPEYLKADKQQPSTPQVLSPVSPFTPPADTAAAPSVPAKAEARNPLKQPTMSDTEAPNLLSIQTHSRNTSDTLTITSEPRVLRSPQPQKSFNNIRVLTPEPSPDKDKTTSPLNLGSPAAHATYFPTVQNPAPPGTIFPGPPLEIVHYECYQSHKFMRSSQNKLCPVGCMICKKKDTEIRWRCTWCCLSACGSCMQVLSSIPGKDLKVCLERIQTGK